MAMIQGNKITTAGVHRQERINKASDQGCCRIPLDVKVAKVNTRITRTGKHASVRLADGYDAEEAALKLGAF